MFKKSRAVFRIVNYKRILSLLYAKLSSFVIIYYLTYISIHNEIFSPLYLGAIAASGLISFWLNPIVVRFYAFHYRFFKGLLYVMLVSCLVLALFSHFKAALIMMLLSRSITDNMVLQNAVIIKRAVVTIIADIFRLIIVSVGLFSTLILGDILLISALLIVETVAVVTGYYENPKYFDENARLNIVTVFETYFLVLPKLFEPVLLLYLVKNFSQDSASIILMNQIIAVFLFFILNSFMYFFEEYNGSTFQVIRLYNKHKVKLAGISLLFTVVIIYFLLIDNAFIASMILLLYYKLLSPMPDYILMEFKKRRTFRTILLSIFLVLVFFNSGTLPVLILLPLLLFTYQLLYEIYNYPQG